MRRKKEKNYSNKSIVRNFLEVLNKDCMVTRIEYLTADGEGYLDLNLHHEVLLMKKVREKNKELRAGKNENARPS